MSVKVCAVILAAGSGNRMQSDTTKQQMLLLGETVLHRTLYTFDKSAVIDSVVVVCKEDELDFVKCETKDIKKIISVVVGGKTRAESAIRGFLKAPADAEFVAIHDCARCLLTEEMLNKVVSDAIKYGAATASRVVTDSVKRVDENGFIISTENRDSLRLMQTPQVFKTDIYRRAVRNLDLSDSLITDDNAMVERIGGKIFCTDISAENIKITYPEDIAFAEFILKGRMKND